MAVGAGPSYTLTELGELWTAAGGGPGAIDTAAAIAMAESSGCRYALAGPVDVRPAQECRWTRTDGENSFGLWQINIAPGANPQYAGTDLFDPQANAAAAVTISSGGQDFTAWSTFNDQAYLAFLPGGSRPSFGETRSQPAQGSVPVTPRPPTPVFNPNPVHLPDAWALFSGALSRQYAQAAYRKALAAAGIGRATR